MVTSVSRLGNAFATAPGLTLARAIVEETDALAVRVIERSSGALALRIAEVCDPRTQPKARPRVFVTNIDIHAVNPCAEDVITGLGREDDLSDAAIVALKNATAPLSGDGTFDDATIESIATAILWCERAQHGAHIALDTALERIEAQCSKLQLNKHDIEAFVLAGALGEFTVTPARGQLFRSSPMRHALQSFAQWFVAVDTAKWAERRKPIEAAKTAWDNARDFEINASEFHARASNAYRQGMQPAATVNKAMSDWAAATEKLAQARAAYEAAEQMFRNRRNAWGKPSSAPVDGPEAA